MNIINPTKKFLKTLLLTGALSLPFTEVLEAQEKPALYGDVFTRYGSNSIISVDNIPDYMRTVPRDSYGYKKGELLIRDDFARTANRISLGGRAGGRFPISENSNLLLGLGLDFNFSDRKSYVNKRSIDDYSSPKITTNAKPTCETPSIADVYFCIHPAYLSNENGDFRLSVFSEIESKLSKDFAMGFGCEFHPEKVIAENGWWNGETLEKNNRYNLADLLVGSFYTSFKFASKLLDTPVFYSIDAGVNKIINKRITEDGRKLDINFNDLGWFVGLKLGTKF